MFSDRLRLLRRERNITQIQLAREIHVSKGTIAMWETAQREANFDALIKLASFFGVTIDFLLGRSPDRTGRAWIDEFDEYVLGISPEEIETTINAFLHLDDYGMRTVQAVVNSEYNRCLQMNSLTDTAPIATGNESDNTDNADDNLQKKNQPNKSVCHKEIIIHYGQTSNED